MNPVLATCFVTLMLIFQPLQSTAAKGKLDAEVAVRQDLIQVALGKQAADLIIRGATVLNAFTTEWMANQDIVIRGERIAWVGPSGTWTGSAKSTVDARRMWAVPGFGESHKHIESSYLTPE